MSTCTSGKRCAVIRQVRWCTAVQTLVNCHCELKENSIRDVEPVELVMQQLTETVRSNFLVPLITRAAAFNTCCNLSVTVLGAPARTVLQYLGFSITRNLGACFVKGWNSAIDVRIN